jgi:hypothetical protein
MVASKSSQPYRLRGSRLGRAAGRNSPPWVISAACTKLDTFNVVCGSTGTFLPRLRRGPFLSESGAPNRTRADCPLLLRTRRGFGYFTMILQLDDFWDQRGQWLGQTLSIVPGLSGILPASGSFRHPARMKSLSELCAKCGHRLRTWARVRLSTDHITPRITYRNPTKVGLARACQGPRPKGRRPNIPSCALL